MGLRLVKTMQDWKRNKPSKVEERGTERRSTLGTESKVFERLRMQQERLDAFRAGRKADIEVRNQLRHSRTIETTKRGKELFAEKVAAVVQASASRDAKGKKCLKAVQFVVEKRVK